MTGRDVQRFEICVRPWAIVQAWDIDLRDICSDRMVEIMGEFEIPKVENTAKKHTVAEDETRGIPTFIWLGTMTVNKKQRKR